MKFYWARRVLECGGKRSATPLWIPSAADGIKHDLVQLLDLDNCGDLDIITCEESKKLGVFWYENPTRLKR